MAIGDRIGTVRDERGDYVEAVFWGLVFLFTFGLFIWEFARGVVEPEEEALAPVATIIDFKQTMFLAALVGGGIFVALIVWAVFRYASGLRDEPEPLLPGQGRLTLTVFSFAVLMILATTIFVGASTLAQTDEASPIEAADQVGASEQIRMEVTAGQWFWRFDVEGIPHTQGENVVLPADTLVVFETTSADVIHSFAIKNLGITKDAIPAQLNQAWFYVGEVTGETSVSAGGQTFAADRYEVRCAELCGKGHSKMLGAVYIVSQEDYGAWAQAVGGEAALEPTGVGGGGHSESEGEGMEGMDMSGDGGGQNESGDGHTESSGGDH